MRLDKLLSNLSYGSRKEIKGLVKDQRITINGVYAKSSAMKIDPVGDDIFVDEEKVLYFEEINLAINKPAGFLSANTDQMHQTVMDLIFEPYNLYDLKIAGRLDLESEGLLLLTTNGQLAHRITSPNFEIDKIYEVITDIEPVHINMLLKGVIIKDGREQSYTAIASKVEVNEKTSHVTINEGKFHQIRRMFKAIGCEVVSLKRIQIGNLKLGDLKPGEYVEFKAEDVYDWYFNECIWLCRRVKIR